MVHEIDTKLLREIGLTSNEIEIYLTLLKSGSITVNVIAEKAGLHRQVVYDSLERLLEKGFVGFIEQKNKRHFHAVSPERIADYLIHQVERFKVLLPVLSSFQLLAKEQTAIDVFKGKNIHRIVYDDVFRELTTKNLKEVIISGVEEARFREADSIALEHHIKRLKKSGISERILIKEGDTDFVEGSQTAYKWVPQEFFSPTPTFVYASTVTIIIWGEPNFAIIIRNEALAKSYQKQFNFLWKTSKKPKH